MRPLIWMLVASLALLGAAHSATSDAAKRHYDRASGLFRQGDFDGAIEALKKSIEIDPRSAESYHLLGLAYFQGEKKPVEAAEALQRALGQ